MIYRRLPTRSRPQSHRLVVGQERIVDHLLIGLLAEGDILLERLPGTTKTLLASRLCQRAGLAVQARPVHT